MEISILHRQGLSLRGIAAETGKAVNTVRKYLQSGPPERRPRPLRIGKVSPYSDYLKARVKAAHPDWIPGAVLAREIREQG